MKKLMYAMGLGLLSGSLWAACMGPYCYDDVGASIAGVGALNGNGYVIPNASSTTIAAIVPTSKGQWVTCTSCTGNSSVTGGIVPCYSTAAVVGSFVIAVSSTPVCK